MPTSERGRNGWTTRRLILAVAVAALLALPVTWFIKLGASLEEFYGKGGMLERQGAIVDHLWAGDRAMAQPDAIAAERHFRSALAEVDRTIGRVAADNRSRLFPNSANALEGLGDALAAQGRTAEAVPFYRQALALWEEKWSGPSRDKPGDEARLDRKLQALARTKPTDR